MSPAGPQKKRWQYHLLSLRQAYEQLKSAIDIALLGRDLSEADRFSLARIFDDSNLPYKIDLLILDDAVSDSLKEHIAAVGKELVLPRR